MSLLKSLLMAASVGERHDYAIENPDFQGLDTVGPPGMGAPNMQRWSAPVNPPQQGLEQGQGRSPGWRWPSMDHTIHENEGWEATAGAKHPAAIVAAKPEYSGWTAPSYYQQYEKPRIMPGITGVVLAIRAGVPFSSTRVLGNEPQEPLDQEPSEFFAPTTFTV